MALLVFAIRLLMVLVVACCLVVALTCTAAFGLMFLVIPYIIARLVKQHRRPLHSYRQWEVAHVGTHH